MHGIRAYNSAASQLSMQGTHMARKPEIWFRQQTGWYMTTVRGQQIKLSQDITRSL
jgi:hypothetical protein